jgi:hypothetical protein
MDFSFSGVLLGIPIINARFFRKRAYERIGEYDSRYRIASDREFLIRAGLNNVICVSLHDVVYRYRQHSGSMTISGNLIDILPAVRENMEIAERYMSRNDVSRELERCLKLWHTRNAALMLFLELSSGHVLDSARTFARGWRWDALWPCGLVNLAAQRLMNAAARVRQTV